MTAAGRILFVDDDAGILTGLRNTFRKQRYSWDMVFADSGESALRELRGAPFDVVVSDMRMPGMDGAALLQHVREEFPAVVRIILSGHSEREALVRSLPVCHQFLSKPCQGDVLKGVLERSLELHTVFDHAGLRDAVGRIEKLPSAPRVFGELTRALSNADVQPSDLAQVARRDPAISAKLLQIVNSSCFGSSVPVTSVEHAVAHLGTDLVRGLALADEIFTVTDGTSALGGCSLDRYQEHSLLCARIACRLLEGRPQAQEAFTAGLLHDIGEIVLAVAALDRNVGCVTHSEVGAYLLGLWGLPRSIVDAVASHHSPSPPSEEGLDLKTAVYVADALATAYGPGRAEGADGRLDPASVEGLATVAELRRWKAVAEDEAARGARVD
jgi:HD-like signal output (HDOD) protein/ActR/RegA family two-component response regulator